MNKKAFTLIELLVVIAIIALLLAILMPALGVVKKKAQGVVCASNVSQLSKAWYAYTADNDDSIVGGSMAQNSYALWADGSPNAAWVFYPQTEDGVVLSLQAGSQTQEEIYGIQAGRLYPYLQDAKVYHCPGDGRYKKEALSPGFGGKGGYRSYSIPSGASGFPQSGAWGILPATRLTQIRQPSSKYIFIEEAEGRGCNLGSWSIGPTGDSWTDPIAVWHNDSSLLGYADGHAKSHKWRDKSTIRIAAEQLTSDVESLEVDPAEGIEDLRFMQEHLPYRQIID